jgi:amino acid adenylation domain-containing protein
LEYLGRIDDQVKIRGYRIELGEIEQAISSHKASGQAVVIARAINNTTDKELIAYTTGEVTAEELKIYLKERLPSYMVPNYYVKLESIPLTNNGKVDRKALPDPEGTGMQQASYIAPSTETEKKLVKIWSEVLGVEEEILSIKADFFDLGGHSIKAIRLLGQTHKQLGVKLALKELFANPTIEQLGKLISESTEKEAYTSIPPIKESGYYAVSSAQRRLWVLSRFEGANEAYNIPQVVRLEGILNEDAFSKAYQLLLTRHEVLRTIFTEDAEGNPRQRILPITHQHFTIHKEDYSKEPQSTREEKIKEYVSEEVSRGFDLEEGPLIRCTLLKESDKSYVWVLVMHHIVSDGWSMGVLHREWSELYNAELEQRAANLGPLSIQYKDYAAWHNAQLQSEAINTHKNYWLEQFKGELPVLELPSDKPRPKVMTYNGASIYRKLDKQTTDNLKTFSQQQGGTMFMTLQTALNILLHKYTGQEDIVIGSPIAGREHPDLEGQIGFYLGALPIRTTFSKEDTVTALYQKIKQNTLGAYSHQVYPYDELVDALNLTRDTSRNPLFDVWLDYHSQEIESEGVSFKQIEQKDYFFSTEENQTKFDLTFIFFENQNKLGLHFEYNKDVYSENHINSILDNLFNVFNLLNNSSLSSISCLNILTNAQSLKLLDCNKTCESNNITVIDKFESNVIENPSNVALFFDGNEYTYEQLNGLSNQFANFLLNNYDLIEEDIVGLLLPRNEWMIIAILGTMKAECCYLPLDVNYPRQRLDYIKADSNCKVVIDEDVIELFQLERFRYNKDNLINKPKANHLAYCIYTSGSTGNPKGVLVEHQQILNTIISQIELFKIDKGDCTGVFASFSFDASISEVFTTLLSGATLYLFKKIEIEDAQQFEKKIELQQISILTITPAYLRNIDISKLSNLKTLISAGEIADKEMLLNVKSKGVNVLNAYGPTETSICATIFELNEEDSKYENIPIGVPINGVYIYLLNPDLQLVPYGSIGEICIGGVGLARGYIDREELTKEKFIANPYNLSERLYRTGDLGRWREDGNLEYLGRMDDQVKIRGYRIELGEIEQSLSSHPESGQVLVIARAINNTTDKDLIAYTTGEATEEELKTYLKERLPSYMVPNYYVKLESIPLTSNGKVDRKALPDPGLDVFDDKFIYDGTWLDVQIQNIFGVVLEIEAKKIPLNVDFYEMGGHSIRLIKLVNLLNKEFDKNLRFRDVLNNSSVLQIRELINKSNTIDQHTFYKLNSIGKHKKKLLLIPPAAGEGLIYKYLAKKLEGFIEVWTLDFSEFKGKEVNVQQFADKLINDWITEQGIEQFYIGGYSIGFRIAYFIGLEHKNKISKLINLDGIIFKDLIEEKKVEKHFKEKYEKQHPNIDIVKERVIDEESIFKNDYFKGKLEFPIIHFLCQETVDEKLEPTFCSEQYKIIKVEGHHNSLMLYDDNVKLISDYLIQEVSLKTN